MSETRLEKVEDVLSGVPVNWGMYVPPGGSGWRKLWESEVEGIFSNALEGAKRELALVLTTKRANEEIQKYAADAHRAAEAMLTAVNDFIEVMPSEDVDRIKAFSKMACELMVVKGVSVAKGSRSVEEIEADIRFARDFKAYINADYDLDRLLFAMHTVDVRYRMKIFRSVMRYLKEVETRRQRIAMSESVLKNLLSEFTFPILGTLDEAYAALAPQLRKLKKLVAANGYVALA